MKKLQTSPQRCHCKVLRIPNFSQDANNNASSEMSQAKKIAELEEKLKQKDAEILGYQVSNYYQVR